MGAKFCAVHITYRIFLAFLLYKDYSLHYIDKKAGQGNYMTGPRSQTWCGRGCDSPPRSSSWKGPGIPVPGYAVSMWCSAVSPFRACLSGREPAAFPKPHPYPGSCTHDCSLQMYNGLDISAQLRTILS